MTDATRLRIAFLGAGEMGSALARASASAGLDVTVWNRTSAKANAVGVPVAQSVGEAVRGADVVVVCLFDHASVLGVLEPVASALAGRRLVNLTTTTPDEARELAEWAAGAGAAYLDGGVMAVPEMIGGPTAEVLYSGSEELFSDLRRLLETWGGATYLGSDAGVASLYDLALLAGMYAMFAGFFHGAAMVKSVGVSASDFAQRATPWLQAMAGAVAEFGAVIDGGTYDSPGQQSLEFSDPRNIVEASIAAGVRTDLVDALHRLVRRQIDAGHGADGYARMIESFAEVAA